jgi:large subunit ribosomal protein L18
MTKIIHNTKRRRQIRTRANLFGTATRPRISIFRSNRYIGAQAIDDENRVTVASMSTNKKSVVESKAHKTEQAKQIGLALGKALAEKKITTGLSDRGSYKYHGRVKALVEGLRESGITI